MARLLPDFQLDRYGIHVRLVNECDAEFILLNFVLIHDWNGLFTKHPVI